MDEPFFEINHQESGLCLEFQGVDLIRVSTNETGQELLSGPRWFKDQCGERHRITIEREHPLPHAPDDEPTQDDILIDGEVVKTLRVIETPVGEFHEELEEEDIYA